MYFQLPSQTAWVNSHLSCNFSNIKLTVWAWSLPLVLYLSQVHQWPSRPLSQQDQEHSTPSSFLLHTHWFVFDSIFFFSNLPAPLQLLLYSSLHIWFEYMITLISYWVSFLHPLSPFSFHFIAQAVFVCLVCCFNWSYKNNIVITKVQVEEQYVKE